MENECCNSCVRFSPQNCSTFQPTMEKQVNKNITGCLFKLCSAPLIANSVTLLSKDVSAEIDLNDYSSSIDCDKVLDQLPVLIPNENNKNRNNYNNVSPLHHSIKFRDVSIKSFDKNDKPNIKTDNNASYQDDILRYDKNWWLSPSYYDDLEYDPNFIDLGVLI